MGVADNKEGREKNELACSSEGDEGVERRSREYNAIRRPIQETTRSGNSLEGPKMSRELAVTQMAWPPGPVAWTTQQECSWL